jgi:hypothetical protein
MTMRPEVSALISGGPMPDSDDASDEDVQHRIDLFESIALPASDAEARALVTLFGPDDYFGLSFSLRRLIESAPSWPIWDALHGEDAWIVDLRRRAINSGYEPPAE